MTMQHGVWSFEMLAQAPPVAGEALPATNGAQGSPANGAQQAPPQSPFGGGFLFLLLGLMVFMIVMSSMGQRKEKKKRDAMLGALSKHDRIQTAGGMIGTIVELRDQEVVVKVDESTNTKIRFARSAVQQVLKKSGGPTSTEEMADESELAQV